MDAYPYEKSDIILNYSCTLSQSESSLLFPVIFCVCMFYAITIINIKHILWRSGPVLAVCRNVFVGPYRICIVPATAVKKTASD